MGAIFVVVRRRFAGRWRVLTAAGLLLGIGFGVSLATFAAARRTASAYQRILVASNAPDAAVTHGHPLAESERSLGSIPGVTEQRVYAGFLGFADGVDRALSTALIAATGDRFPIELPKVKSGRLPDPDAPDEVFVNAGSATDGGLHVGQRLRFTLFTPNSSASTRQTVTIVGVGTYPLEIVSDETNVLGLVVFTPAFYRAHRDVSSYSVSSLYLAPGVDAQTDLAPAITKLGHTLQSSRTLEHRSVNAALRPLVVSLVALGLLALAATMVAAAQVIQRDRDRWRADGATLIGIGMVRGQLRVIQLMTGGVIAALAALTALALMALASPIAPIGPLHDFDPARGFALDLAVAGLGVLVVMFTLALCSFAFSPFAALVGRPTPKRALSLSAIARRPAMIAGLTLAIRPEGGRVRTWRAVAATTVAAVLLGISVAWVAAATTLIHTPARYGFDADLLAINRYGDQSPLALKKAFVPDDQVAAATGFTTGAFLLDGRAVPSLVATAVKAEVTPTLLRGGPARNSRQIVVGQDTLDSLGKDLGDDVWVQLPATTGQGGKSTADAIALRIVGVATFPAIDQSGADLPRLGIGALLTRDAYIRLRGDTRNDPEFTTVRMVPGADPSEVIDRIPEGFVDAFRSNTIWFTDTKPAEIRQLDVAMPYLRGALAFGYVILFAVAVHALWTRVRSNRRDLAVLRALGATRGQLDAVTAWQAAPFTLATIVVGLPIGIALGRWGFTLFARSLAVVADATVSASMLATLVAAIFVAFAVAALVSVVVARRDRSAVVLRGD